MKKYITCLYVLASVQIGLAQLCHMNFDMPVVSTCSLEIDTVSDPDNVWQVAKPNKSVFDATADGQNVIITDSLNTYPINSQSYFVVSKRAALGFSWPHTAYINGWYFVNSDSLNDFGTIEFSPDNGSTWIDLIKDTAYIEEWNWYTERPILTGNSNGWKNFFVDLTSIAFAIDIEPNDTVQYRFGFFSDSITDGLDGLMFDNLFFEDYAEGIHEINYAALQTKTYPNPAHDYFTIEIDGIHTEYLVRIFSLDGALLDSRSIWGEKHLAINNLSLTSGIYFYEIVNHASGLVGRNKFIIE